MEHGNYWHNAIFPDTLTGLTLLATALPDDPVNFLDWGNVVHPGAPTQCQVDELNRRIGADGMTIQVTGGAPDLRGLPPAPTQTRVSMLLGRLSAASRATSVELRGAVRNAGGLCYALAG